ncbi:MULTISPECIES: hypothetical protein [Burkholderia]|uniref:hypothetical protein n=1 Tax=Burkholderia TaxID=32008 RepID=UPI0011AFAD45|nr:MULTISPECIES: hypothetical protein [unclassified Burkholderia]
MLTTIKWIKLNLLPVLAWGTFAIGIVDSTQAATIINEGNAAGIQCESIGVNNTGSVVGNCMPSNANNPVQAWVALKPGSEISLPPLVPGQPCLVGTISNSGLITGECESANDVWFAVTWMATSTPAAPTKLEPLSGLVGLGADVSTHLAAASELGVVVGQSESVTGNRTAVMYAANSKTPISVSSPGDNCSPVDVNDTPVNGGLPTVALNCPNASGTTTASYAQNNGILGAFTITALPLPANATYCTVTSVNNKTQFAGTCHFSAPDLPKAAFWAGPTSAPQLLTLANFPRHSAFALNNLGHVLVTYENSNGQSSTGFWDPASHTLSFIQPLPGGTSALPAALARDADKALLNSEVTGQHWECEVWSLSGGAIAEGFEGGGLNDSCDAISNNGMYATGVAENSSENLDATLAIIP